MVTVNSEAIFVGANQQNQVSDYDKERKLVAFGSGKTVALWHPLDAHNRGISLTLKGHDAEVTCVKFIPGTCYMVSTSEDFHIKIWKFSDDKVHCIQTIKHYNHTIVALTTLPNLIAIGCANGLVSLWTQDLGTGEFIIGNEFEVQRGFLPLCLSLSNVISNKYLLAVGGTNVNAFIFSFVLNGQTVDNCALSAKLEGHEDWIKSLAFRHQETPGDYFLCSGSQDRYIRLWRIRINDLIDASDEDEAKLSLLNNKQYKFNIEDDLKVAINFDALIMGHDDWISSLRWHDTRLQLLASTADTALMVWEPDEASGIWVCGLRLGELSSKGASTATGSAGGFWSCLWFTQNDVDYILTNSRTGAWRFWSVTDGTIVEEMLGITGTTKPVTDVAWAPNDDYLLSTSLDQTTRLYAPWTYKKDGSNREIVTWHEFSRPQIHGYDMICIEPMSNKRFVSGGDEKILRSFDEPKGVAQILKQFVNPAITSEENMPESASLPVLGLSNKAAADDNDSSEEPENEDEAGNKNISYNIVSSLSSPPTESELQRHLLWPEIEKLYGHGYEMTCLDISSDGELIASACKSNTPQHAVIRIFDTQTWLEVKPPLGFHSLTITRLRFSKDSKYLLSVCRDRKWAVWERNFEDNTFKLMYSNEKPHSRIIWDGEWTPLEFGNCFVTASRDRTIKLWEFSESSNDYVSKHSIRHEKPVTGLSVYDKTVGGKILVAAGLEDGNILIYTYQSDGFELVCNVDASITPADRINRLRWCHSEKEGRFLLACSSNDNSTRIYSISI
ncbi:hypothetical protein KAFR_0G01170 [Kazachstania africana CBS 2517]|uniref:Elongator complex protein 2 n=1 Tax=Kazachstania africana (strain ATCC 22294 / BCRC 22015 / CBS 2517 / CECT 1963 / NBRC 1671 / NRRL Y-8276) TaxID=1071382 RepID=H2AXQ0_KAZAF|nr:hypothetical protein KAFR_0G01170 [Kazachstania africana CBS 2517]CCF59150.1 hypothetical protein KAFR_0G01170 [Kazachstania africana CBS 2517]